MFYLINKEVGMTSFQVIRELRKKLGIKKMGHIGTLDPLASGLMLIATEQSTKLLSFLNTDKKGYIFRTELDGTTESLDAETPVQSIDISTLSIPSAQILETNLQQTTSQIPPKFSAIHIDGKRAYKLARKEKDFVIPSRKITVYEAKILDIQPRNITTEIVISSGGYIRSFAPQIAEWCGVQGGYISLLHRHQLFFGDVILTENDAQSLENFNQQLFIPEEKLFEQFWHISSSDPILEENIRHGIPPQFNELGNIPLGYSHILLTFASGYATLLHICDQAIKIVKNDIKSLIK